jgi:L-ribulokinase
VAGGYASIEAASHAMARVRDTVYTPNPAAQATYDVLYREYVRLHDYFGRGENDVMRTLKGLRVAARRAAVGA